MERGVRTVTTYDVRKACDVLRPVYDASDGIDGRVSIEVDPRLANDTDKTIAEARRAVVDRRPAEPVHQDPGHREGLPAITRRLAEGISVNVTLIFSLERHREVIDAYMAGLEKAREAGHDISKIRSVASFFVSRVDTEVDKRLDKIGSAEALGAARQGRPSPTPGWPTSCTSRSPPTVTLAGAEPPGRECSARCGPPPATKNPAYPDTLYVTELVAADTVNTMPEATINAIADHGELRRRHRHGTVRRRPGGLRRRWRQLGIDLRRRGSGARRRGRREVRGVLERAARHDQTKDLNQMQAL